MLKMKLIIFLLLFVGFGQSFSHPTDYGLDQSRTNNKLVAAIDRSKIFDNESITLELTLSGQSNSDTIDFRPLRRNFEIISSSKSSQLQVFNGQSQSKTVWRMVLFPKQTGHLKIPVFSLGVLKTKPFTILVSKATNQTPTKEKHFFFETTIIPKKPYPNAQVVYTSKLFYNAPIEHASLSLPTSAQAPIKPFGKPLHYSTLRQGHSFQVLEQRFILFPQSQLSIEPPQLTGWILNPKDLSMQPIRVIGQRMVVHPKSRLMEGLPAARLTLMQHWEGLRQVGEPITRTVILSADGLSREQLPPLPTFDLEGMNVYPSKPDIDESVGESGLRTVLKQKIIMIPTRSGDYLVPDIRIQWWNTKTKRSETAHLSGKHLKIAVSPVSDTSPPVLAKASASAEIHTSGLSRMSNSSQSHFFTQQLPWIIAILSLGLWIITLLLLSRKNKSSDCE